MASFRRSTCADRALKDLVVTDADTFRHGRGAGISRHSGPSAPDRGAADAGGDRGRFAGGIPSADRGDDAPRAAVCRRVSAAGATSCPAVARAAAGEAEPYPIFPDQLWPMRIGIVAAEKRLATMG